MSVVDSMMRGGAPAFKFENVMDKITGVVVEVDQAQGRDYDDSTLLLWWAGGGKTRAAAVGNPGDEPFMIPIFTLKTELNDGTEEDSGLRSLWLRGNMYSAVRDALRSAYRGRKFGDADLIGGTLTLQFHALGEKRPKMNPPKLFRAKFEPASVMGGDDWTNDKPAAPAPAPAPLPAPKATPAAQPAPAATANKQTDADW